MTEILEASSDADLLAMAPTLLGCTPTESIALLLFAGKGTGGGMRLDLPRRRTGDYKRLSAFIVEYLRRMPGIDGVVPVIYTGSTFAEEQGTPWLELSRVLIRRLEREGFDVKNALCVAADGWASYFDRDYPRVGRPLAEVGSNDLGVLARLTAGRDPADLAHGAILPDPDPRSTAYLADGLAMLERARAVLDGIGDEADDRAADSVICEHDDDVRALNALLDEVERHSAVTPTEFIEHLLRVPSPTDERPREIQLWLLAMLQAPATRDDVMVQVAFGADAVAAGPEFGSMLLLGRHDEQPDVERLEVGIALIATLCASAPIESRAPLLCLLGWWNWALGRGSIGGAHIDAALAIDPAYGMADLLHALLSGGRMPDWAFAAFSRRSADHSSF